MLHGQPLKYIESLRAIILVFSKFRMPIFVEKLSAPTEVLLCQGSNVYNN